MKFLTKIILSLLIYINCYGSDNNWYELKPLKNVSFRTFFYPAVKYYPYYKFYNSYGEFLKNGWNSFLQLNGSASLIEKFYFNYRIQLQNFDNVYFQNLNISYRDKSVSLMYGLDSVWLGNGYHGSLLLSNNSTPFKILKFQTEKPFYIPFVGRFTYRFIHGWLDNFKLLAHRVSYLPFNWIEFGVNQTVAYQQNYKLWEFFKVFSAAEENIPGQKFDNDQRASFDIALHLEFLNSYIPFITGGKIYYEYAGEDLFAWWQKEDKVWIGPLGFEFFDPAYSYGLQIDFLRSRFCLEYSQNYKIQNIFRNVHVGTSYQNLTKKWYRKVPFIQNEFFVGHHMGSESDDFYLEYYHLFKYFGLKFFYHHERHGLASSYGNVYKANSYPETFTQIGFEINKNFDKLNIALLFISNDYLNIDVNKELLDYLIIKDLHESNSIFGIKILYSLSE
ncbi:MAG: hypothetical protein IGBAC_0767 [Ignavibacteriae bacterium]|nr:MAG: hypothetical protein IGBAC_0767 [Ignavibacteriota bacterium]